jgi:hypothetical protein
MKRIETLETLIRIEELINLAEKQVAWRLNDLQTLDLSGFPSITKRYEREVEIKQKAIVRLEQRFNRILLTLNK